MLGKTHMIAGMTIAGLYICSTPTTNLPTITMAVAAGATGGLLPDIDHPNSKISHKLKPVSKLVSLLFAHRGLFHTPILYIILWTLAIWQISNSNTVMLINALFLGIMSHLFLDALNPTGIPLLFPFENKHRNLAHIKTGGLTEKIIYVCILFFFFCTTAHFYTII